jgi:hypothetical protein
MVDCVLLDSTNHTDQKQKKRLIFFFKK